MNAHEIDTELVDGPAICKWCGQLEGALSPECPGPTFGKQAPKAGEILTKHGNVAFEHVPDRLGIAAQLLSAIISSGKYERHFIFAAVPDAVELADKLIARIKETQK